MASKAGRRPSTRSNVPGPMLRVSQLMGWGTKQTPPWRVHGLDRLLDAAQAGNRRFEVERDDVTLEGRDLDAGHEVEAEAASCPRLARSQRYLEAVVFGDRDDVEVGLRLDVVEDALDGIEAVAGVGVDMKVGFAHRRHCR